MLTTAQLCGLLRPPESPQLHIDIPSLSFVPDINTHANAFLLMSSPELPNKLKSLNLVCPFISSITAGQQPTASLSAQRSRTAWSGRLWSL